MKVKIKFAPLIIWMAVLTTSLYVVANNLPAGVGSFRFFWGPLVLIVILVTKPATFTRKPMRSLLFYGIIILGILQYTLWKYMPDWNRLGLLEEFYSLLVFTTIFCYYIANRDFKGLAILGKISFIFIIITIITTNIALSYDPLIVRQSAAPGGFTSYQEQIFKLTGAGGYGYMQALVCLIPIVIYYIKFPKQIFLSRKILIIILVFLFITLIRAQVFANILAASLITMISFTSVKNSRKSLIAISFIFIILLAIPISTYANLFASVSRYFDPDSDIFYKLNDFSTFIEDPELNNTTGAGGRALRYPLLLDALVVNPLTGYASYESRFDIGAGGHLYWMNRITQWGVFGFLFFIFVFFRIYKSVRSLFDDSFGFYYFLAALAFIFLGLMKNMGSREPYFMLIVVIPGLYYLQFLKNRNNRKVNNDYIHYY